MSSRARESGCFPAKHTQAALFSAIRRGTSRIAVAAASVESRRIGTLCGPPQSIQTAVPLPSDPASAERAARPGESEYPSGLRTDSTPFRPRRGTLTTHPLSARKIPAPSKASKRRSAAALTPNDEPRPPEGKRVRADTKRQGKAGTSSPPAPPGSAGVGEHRKVPHGPNGAHPSR